MKKKLDILLVEDSNFDYRWIHHEVTRSRSQCELTRAATWADGHAAIERALVPFDIIILDLNLPDSSGLETLRKVVAMGSSTPIIVLSSEDGEAVSFEAANLGAHDFLVKGSRAGGELRKAMQFVMSRQAARQELEKRIDILRQAATLDPLTGVFNRREMMQRFADAFDGFQKSGRAASCILCDLDHFKLINNEYGHCVGDEILRRFAAAISSRVRKSDSVFRFGGEEFCILMPKTVERDAWRIAKKMQLCVAEEKLMHEGTVIRYTASFGVAELRSTMTCARDLLDLADTALYRAKETRNAVATATNMSPLQSCLT